MSLLEIHATGMVTCVGLTAPVSCAAIRSGISGADETRFMFDDEWLIGCETPLDKPWRGTAKIERMASLAVEECLKGIPVEQIAEIPLLLAVSEEERPGRLSGLDDSLITRIEEHVGFRFHPWSRVFPSGGVGGVRALEYSRRVLSGGCARAIVAGVDSLLVAPSLERLHEDRLLLTPGNSDGFIPGEAAGALLVGGSGSGGKLSCTGIGFGVEPAPLGSGEPFRAQGMVDAFREALDAAGWALGVADYRIADLSGPQFGFKEAALAMTRVLRERKEIFDIWHPADCIGETGAAAVPIMVSVVVAASEKGYAPGPRAIAHVSSGGVDRAAFLLAPVDGGIG